jgi:hypothetical protein
MRASVTKELANSRRNKCCINLEPIAALVGQTFTFSAHEDVESLIEFFWRFFLEGREAYPTVRLENICEVSFLSTLLLISWHLIFIIC